MLTYTSHKTTEIKKNKITETHEINKQFIILSVCVFASNIIVWNVMSTMVMVDNMLIFIIYMCSVLYTIWLWSTNTSKSLAPQNKRQNLESRSHITCKLYIIQLLHICWSFISYHIHTELQNSGFAYSITNKKLFWYFSSKSQTIFIYMSNLNCNKELKHFLTRNRNIPFFNVIVWINKTQVWIHLIQFLKPLADWN